jgi:hypothetical protein
MSGVGPARDIVGLGAWAVRWLVAQAILSAVAVAVALGRDPISRAVAVALGFDPEVSYDPGVSPGAGLVALLQFAVFLVAGFVVLRWIWFATANAHAFGAQSLRFGPWLAVGAYFIPIANLVMPLQSMRDTWKASVEPRDWEIVEVPAILGWWWAFWLAGNIAGIAAFRLSDAEEFPGLNEAAATLTIVSDALTVVASVLLAVIVRRLSALQQTRAVFAA